MSEERFIDRLEAFMKAEGLNANKVTVAAELSNGLLGKALKTRGSMNSDSVERILCAFKGIRARMANGQRFPGQRGTAGSGNDRRNRDFHQRTLHRAVRAHHRREVC